MSYQSLGQMKAAEATFREAFSVPAYTDFLELNRKAWPEFLLARSRYEEALHASQELTKGAWPVARLAGHTLAGEAFLAMDRSKEAQDELSLAEQETEHVPVNLWRPRRSRAFSALNSCSATRKSTKQSLCSRIS